MLFGLMSASPKADVTVLSPFLPIFTLFPFFETRDMRFLERVSISFSSLAPLPFP